MKIIEISLLLSLAGLASSQTQDQISYYTEKGNSALFEISNLTNRIPISYAVFPGQSNVLSD